MTPSLNNTRRLFELGLFVPFALAHQLVGVALGQLVHANLVPWYAGLAKPPLTPPSWVFGLGWAVLYLVMAYCLARVWARFVPHLARNPAARAQELGKMRSTGKKAVFCGVLQLAVNVVWAVLFFGYHKVQAGALVLMLLFALVCLTAWLYNKIDRLSGFLFIPYVAWLGFMLYLGLGILWLNPS